MSPKLKQILNFLKRKPKQVPEDQDSLGAYPLRMQITAIPERRYTRTARLLAVFSLLNMAVMMVLASWFAYNVVRLDVSVANWRAVNLYAMDPENKIIQAAEYDEIGVPAMTLAMEKGVRDYITARYSINLDSQKQVLNWGPQSVLALYTHPEKLKAFYEHEMPVLLNVAQRQGVNREVHIYSMRQTPSGLWEALIDIFDMKPRNPYRPICVCDDNSRECLDCKAKHNLGRQRYRVYVRAGFNGRVSILNPLGIMILGIYMVPQPIHENEKFWNLPSILRSEL